MFTHIQKCVMHVQSCCFANVKTYDVTAVILVSQNNETAAMLVVPNQSAGSSTLFLCK